MRPETPLQPAVSEPSSGADTDAFDLLRANPGRILGEIFGRCDPLDVGTEDQVGSFCLKEVLGEGGFGVVWRAEQCQPIQREVALKVLKQGMDSVQVLARFNQERQTLASMNHPSIAAFIDAGMGPDGRPFFAMELVRGESITSWCESQHSPIHERLRLFTQVCAAVQHAHQKGIIHRDIKPSNILVCPVEVPPTAKVIDFGIAKALQGQDLSDDLLKTLSGQLLGTPRHMSPEQLTGAGPVDTRTDIYSLGVVLYELLTGELPYGRTGSLEELRQRVNGPRPDRPSTRLRHRDRTEGSAAMTLPYDPGTRSFDSDLDWITMKALEHQPDRRYQTVTELAEDIRRFLQHEPVLARKPSFGYVAGRWIGRNRAASVAAAAIFLSMVLATTISLWYATEALEARAAAERHAANASNAETKGAHTADFLTGLLDKITQEVKAGRNPEALKAALADTLPDILDLDHSAELRVQLINKVEQIYAAIGEPKLAIPFAKAKLEELIRTHGSDTAEAWEAEKTYILWQVEHGDRQQGPNLINALQSRVEAREEHGSKFWLELQRQLTRTWIKLDAPEQALEASETLLAVAAAKGLKKGNLALYRIMRAEALEAAGRFQEARELLIETLGQTGSPSHHQSIENRLIYLCKASHDWNEGAVLLQNRIDRLERQKGTNARAIMMDLTLLSEFQSRMAQRREAIATMERALTMARETGAARDTIGALRSLAERKASAKMPEEAVSHAKEALAMARRLQSDDLISLVMGDLAEHMTQAGELEGAYGMSEECYNRVKTLGANQRRADWHWLAMTTIRIKQGRLHDATEMEGQLWNKVKSLPESVGNMAYQKDVAKDLLRCWLQTQSLDPSFPEPALVAEWRRVAGEDGL